MLSGNPSTQKVLILNENYAKGQNYHVKLLFCGGIEKIQNKSFLFLMRKLGHFCFKIRKNGS